MISYHYRDQITHARTKFLRKIWSGGPNLLRNLVRGDHFLGGTKIAVTEEFGPPKKMVPPDQIPQSRRFWSPRTKFLSHDDFRPPGPNSSVTTIFVPPDQIPQSRRFWSPRTKFLSHDDFGPPKNFFNFLIFLLETDPKSEQFYNKSRTKFLSHDDFGPPKKMVPPDQIFLRNLVRACVIWSPPSWDDDHSV